MKSSATFRAVHCGDGARATSQLAAAPETQPTGEELVDDAFSRPVNLLKPPAKTTQWGRSVRPAARTGAFPPKAAKGDHGTHAVQRLVAKLVAPKRLRLSGPP